MDGSWPGPVDSGDGLDLVLFVVVSRQASSSIRLKEEEEREWEDEREGRCDARL